MKKSEFIQEVCNEINTIKERATKKEIGRLNFDKFEHANIEKCIYGQMTGDCGSERAKDLYMKSLDAVPKPNIYAKHDENGNDVYKFKDLDLERGDYFTYLESYLFTCSRKTQKEIIEYLKGESTELYIK